MDFELNEEQKLLKETIREFAKEEILPLTKITEKEGRLSSEIIRKLADMGVMGMTVPVDYGGSGMDYVSCCIVIEEIARVCPSTAVAISVHTSAFCYPILKFGNEEQKRNYLPRASSGEILGSFSLTEPSVGSDASAIQAKASKENGFYILNGTKNWVTSGADAGAFIMMTRTSPEPSSKSISSFIVDANTPNLRISKIEDKMGLRSSPTAEISLDGCKISEKALLGKEGEGLKIALHTLDVSRIGIAAQAVGIAQSAFEEALKYSKIRKTFGKLLCEHQAVQFMLAEMSTYIEAARLLTYKAAYLKDKGLVHTKESSMAKLYASEIANKVTYLALQIHGAYGYSKEFIVEKLFRDARVTTIYEGTSEIQKLIIARNLLSSEI
ncbi:MAG: acyl-CoA dehydrogenase family protein [Candidatus Aminicenantia bacterium]